MTTVYKIQATKCSTCLLNGNYSKVVVVNAKTLFFLKKGKTKISGILFQSVGRLVGPSE